MRATALATTTGRLATALALFSPTALHGQAPRASQTLAIPVASIGSCTAATAKPAFLIGASGLRGATIVIAADQPSRRREVSLFVDRGGKPAEYDEANYGPTVSGGAGQDVIWAKDASATVRSYRLRHLTAPGAAIHHERVKLSAADRKDVQSMIAWMTARCDVLLRST